MSPLEELRFFISFLYNKHPFYNSILSNMELSLISNDLSRKYKIYSPKFKKILIDETFAKELIKKEKKLLFYYLIHEVLHNILNHPYRKGSRIDKRWDEAADITVDSIILKDETLKNLVAIPHEFEDNIVKVYDYKKEVSSSVEEVYETLKHQQQSEEEQEAQKDNNQHLDNHSAWNDEEENEEEDIEKKKDTQDIFSNNNQNEINEILIKANEFCKLQESDNIGGIPGHFNEIISTLLKPKTNLKNYLNKVIQKCKKTSHNYKRGDRRYLYNNLIVPSHVRDVKHFNLLFYIDTSGSMDIKGLQQTISEISYVVNSLKSFNIDIIMSDTDISGMISVTEQNLKDLNNIFDIKGRGGTELAPLFKYVKENNNTYDVIIINTDFHIRQSEMEEFISLEKKQNILSLIPKNHNQENVSRIEKTFYL